MAFTYSFVDNAVYGTDDINDITKSLTGAGVAPFVSKDSYSTSDLNVMTAALVEAGVQLDGCKCSVNSAGTAEMSVTVAQGIVFFESGVRLTVDGYGYTVFVTPNTAGYVYAYFSPSLQKADIVFGSELPTDGEYVLLAELAADGTATDKRTFARSKVATLGKNVILKKPFTELASPVLYKEGESINEYIVSKVQGVDMSKFNYVIAVRSGTFDEFVYFPTNGSYTGFFDVTTRKMNLTVDGIGEVAYGRGVDSFFRVAGDVWDFTIRIIENELCLVCKCSADKIKSVKNGGVTIMPCTAVIM